MRGWFEAGKNGVLACSALKEKYRATLAAGMPAGAVTFVWLDGSRELLSERLAERHHEFMNPKLLESQLETLEPPKDALRIVNDRSAGGDCEPDSGARFVGASLVKRSSKTGNQEE